MIDRAAETVSQQIVTQRGEGSGTDFVLGTTWGIQIFGRPQGRIQAGDVFEIWERGGRHDDPS
jgi:hypothetical protein